MDVFMPVPQVDIFKPELSIILISYNMRREIPRALRSFSVPYQRNVQREQYEVILVDNGSERPWASDDFSDLDVGLRVLNLAGEALPSPARAANRGIAAARAPLIGVLIDGARLVSPGLFDSVLRAARLYPRPIIATANFHLGVEHQYISVRRGYTPETEDRLLASIDWPADGYCLLDISVFDGSCADGWFQPLAESNALFLPSELWNELGGFDEAFQLPGGGLLNLDLYQRALELRDTRLVQIIGEGNFHQLHRTVSSDSVENRWAEWAHDYRQIRGREYAVRRSSAVYFGSIGLHGVGHLDHSVKRLQQRASGSAAADYIEILEKSLLNETNLELELAFLRARDAARGRVPYDERELLDVAASMPQRLALLREFRAEGRLLDGDLANMPQGYTMIGRRRMDNLRFCIETVLYDAIPGDLIECGVWKGGACIFMRGILKAHGVTDRIVWVADSFRGLPDPDPQTDDDLDLSEDRFPQLAIPLAAVQKNFELFGLLDDQVRFLPGWFSETLPSAPLERIAVLRLDGDLYSSTVDILTNVYDKVSPGGFLIVDDYGVLPQCARAVDEFRAVRGITTPIEPVDCTGVFWRKEF
jgi:glycosyltransferase involved in cell wall biosynthesis